MQTGLVLEGGAMRGMYTAGALDVLMENGVTAEKVVGVSAGALFGVNFLSRQQGRVIRYNKRFNADKDYLGWRPLLREGNIISTEYAYDRVPRELDRFDDEAFMHSGVPFFAVVTNVETGKAEYMQIKSVFAQMDALRASGSMPFVSRMVKIGDKKYLDGGIADSIPYRWMAQQGCDKVLVILTRDRAYRKHPAKKAPIRLFYGRFPRLAACLIDRHTMYNNAVEELNQWEKAGKAFVLRPSHKIEIERIETDPQRLQAVYDLGRQDALAQLEQIKAYLQR